MRVRIRFRGNLSIAPAGPSPEDMFQPLTVMSITNPMDFGAAGNGTTNDLTALQAAVTALPAAGGVVYFPAGKTFRKNTWWDITKDHVKLWRPCAGYQPGREATINAFNSDVDNAQSIRWNARTGGGAFGLKVVSNATVRKGTFEDMGLVYLTCTDVENVGCELVGMAAATVCISSCTRSYNEHNYVHNSFADGFFHAYDTTSFAYNWANFGTNVGDDFVSVVTDFGATMPHDIETWLNTIVVTPARGFSVIGGGPNINIHDNWAVSTGAAGLIFASESSFNTETVTGVAYSGNKVVNCCTIVTSHSGILVSGGNPSAAALSNIAGTGNWSVNSGAQPYRSEGSIGTGVTSTGLQTTVGSLPAPTPVAGDATHGDTTILRTRDVSHVAAGSRPGLYRIHVRLQPGFTSVFQQRFEYVFSGSAANVAAVVSARLAAGDYLSESRDVSGTTYALMLTKAPFAIGGTVSAVTFAQLRAGDLNGTLSWLWARIDTGSY